MNATVVARVIDAHTPTGSQGDITCWCNQRFESWAEHAMHVAAAVLAALELREEWGVVDKDGHPFATWHKSRASAQEHCDTNVRSFQRSYGHIPEVADLAPQPVPVRRFVSPWQPIGEENP